MRNRPIQLNDIQKTEALNIFARAAYEANCHVRKILLSGCNLFTLAGTEITLGKAITRRRRNIHRVKQALRGFIL